MSGVYAVYLYECSVGCRGYKQRDPPNHTHQHQQSVGAGNTGAMNMLMTPSPKNTAMKGERERDREMAPDYYSPLATSITEKIFSKLDFTNTLLMQEVDAYVMHIQAPNYGLKIDIQ
jgi:hypothetical protein